MGFSVLKCSLVNGSINDCFSSCVLTINDYVPTTTLGLNCGIHLVTLQIKIFTKPLLSKLSCREKKIIIATGICTKN